MKITSPNIYIKIKTMYYYFYKTTNLVNGKYYYGVHHTDDLNDGYLGSGKRLKQAIEKYGIENFKKEILKYFDDEKSMFEYEAQIVTEKVVKDRNTYNVALGGFGGNLRAGYSDEENEIYSKKMSDINKKHYQEHPERSVNHSKALKDYYSDENNYKEWLKKHDETVKSQEYRKTMSERMTGEGNPMFGYEWSEEQRNAMGETMTEVWKDPIHKQNLMNGLAKRGDEWRDNIRKSRKGKYLVNNGVIAKYIDPSELNKYLSEGWVRKRLFRKRL